MARHGLIAAAFVIGVGGTVAAGPAEAGPLSKVVSGLKERSGQTGGSSGGSSSESSSHERDHRSDSSDNDSFDSDSSGSGSSSNHHGSRASRGRRHLRARPLIFVGAYPYPTNTAGTDVRVYMGLQSVDESNGALSGSIRSSYGDLGIEIDDVRYYERVRTGSGADYLQLDVWSMSVAYRAMATGPGERTAVWLKGGLAGAHSDGLGIFGLVLGAEVAHNVSENVGIESSARVFSYQDHIRALELRTGVAASILRVSYRLLKFNVGPPLQGPEVGVSLSF